VFLTGTVSFLVAFAVLGQDNKDQLTAESVEDFTVRILSIENSYILNPGKGFLIRTVRNFPWQPRDSNELIFSLRSVSIFIIDYHS